MRATEESPAILISCFDDLVKKVSMVALVSND